MSSASPSNNASSKVWLITSATSPLGFSIARQALRNGDRVVAGCTTEEFAVWRDTSHSLTQDENATPNNNKKKAKLSDGEATNSLDVGILSRLGGHLCLVTPLYARSLASCQAALAHANSVFGRVDILLSCTSHSYCGALEETTDWEAREQFEVTYFGNINIIKTVVKDMRERGTGGHIICVTSLAAQTGTPGLSLITAAHHAVEGFNEALAFEVAPFNIRLTNVEPSLMTHLLLNPVHLPPVRTPYSAEPNIKESVSPSHDEDDDDEDDDERLGPRKGVSSLRKMLESVLLQDDQPTENGEASIGGSVSTNVPFPKVLRYPNLAPAAQLELASETARVILAVAGKDNPPGRIIVGGEESGEDGEGGVQSVKERMKTVSEELEEFLECSMSVDVPNAVVNEQVEEVYPTPT